MRLTPANVRLRGKADIENCRGRTIRHHDCVLKKASRAQSGWERAIKVECDFDPQREQCLSQMVAQELVWPAWPAMSAFGGKADIAPAPQNVRFSNRPVGVKRFQTIHQCSVDVARGLALLFGIGTKALPSWDSRTRWNNLFGGLAVRPTAGSSGHANSPHPSSREGHHSTARWSSSVLLLD